ncbi:O-antigen ligase family protein [bacterium]|nr:O-antigen ligase family protein [bacterium]
MTKERLRLICNQGILLSLMAMLLVVPLVFYTKTHDVFEFNKLTAFRIFLLMASLAYLTKVLLLGKETIRSSALWPPIALIGISSLLSTLWTNNFVTSVFGVYEDFEGILTIAGYGLLFFLVNQYVRHLKDINKFLAVIVAAGLLAGGYGVAQNFGIDFIKWNPHTYTASRLFGSLGNPNFLAAYLLMVLPIAMMLFLAVKQVTWKRVLLLIIVIIGLAIFFTKSRGAFYALVAEAVVLAAYVFWDIKKMSRAGNISEALWTRNKRWLLVLAVLAGLTLFSPYVRSNISTTVTRTIATMDMKSIKITPRLYIWRSALQMMRDKPIIGSGLDTFQITFPKYRLAEYWRLEWNGTPEKAHNFFLQIGATTGFLGLGAWLWLLVAFYAVLWKQLKTLPPYRRHVTAAIGIAQLGFIVQNQFNFTVIGYGSLFWFLLALGTVLPRQTVIAGPAQAGETEFSLSQLPLNRWMAFLGSGCLILLLMMFSLRLWSADVYFKRGIIYLARGYPQQAIAELGRAAAINPHREIYWVKYGIAYEEAAKRATEKEPLLEKAAKIHKHTMGMNPLNGYDYNNLGRVYKYWGDFVNKEKLKDAEAATRKASELDPYNVYFALDLASVYLSQKRWVEAETIVDRLIKIFPDFAIPYSYKGYVALMQQNQEAAYQHFTAASEKNWRGDVNTHSSTWSNLGIVRARKGMLEASIEAFDKALKIKPQYLEARLNKALILEQRGMGREAAGEYRYIIQQAPNYPRVEELKRKIKILERGAKP